MKNLLSISVFFIFISNCYCQGNKIYLYYNQSNCGSTACILGVNNLTKIDSSIIINIVYSEKDSIFKNDFINRHFKNIQNRIEFIFSDSMYNIFNKNVVSTLYIFNNNQLVKSIPLHQVEHYLDKINCFHNNKLQINTYKFPDSLILSKKTIIKTYSNRILIIDKTKNIVHFLLLDSIFLKTKFYKSIHESYFNWKSFYELSNNKMDSITFKQFIKQLNDKNIPLFSFKNACITKNKFYLILKLNYPKIKKEKTIIAERLFIAEFDTNFNYKLYTINNRINFNNYIYPDEGFSFTENNRIICRSEKIFEIGKLKIISELKILNNKVKIKRTLGYKIPDYHKNLKYNLSSQIFCSDLILYNTIPQYIDLNNKKEIDLNFSIPNYSSLNEYMTINSPVYYYYNITFFASTSVFQVIYWYNEQMNMGYFNRENGELIRNIELPYWFYELSKLSSNAFINSKTIISINKTNKTINIIKFIK